MKRFSGAVLALAFFGSCGRQETTAPPVVAASSDAELAWGAARHVPGTAVVRIDLVHRSSGLSSGYSEVRNILFLDPGQKTGRWLLPDSRHVFAESVDLANNSDDPNARTTLGTVALLKEVGEGSDQAPGRLVAYNPAGTVLETVSERVTAISTVAVAPSGEYEVVFQRQRQFVACVLDKQSFKVTREQVFDVPPLK